MPTLPDTDLTGPIPKHGEILQRTIDELVEAKRRASDMAKAFGDAIAAVAEQAQIKPSALRRYVCALAGDKVDDVERETDDLAALLEHDA